MSYRIENGKTGTGAYFITTMKDWSADSGLSARMGARDWIGLCGRRGLSADSGLSVRMGVRDWIGLSVRRGLNVVSGLSVRVGVRTLFCILLIMSFFLTPLSAQPAVPRFAENQSYSGVPASAAAGTQHSVNRLTESGYGIQHAQHPVKSTRSPEPSGAFLRSLAVPGWGHHYADRDQWNRGKVHLTAEVLLIAGLTGSLFQVNNLKTTVHTQAALRAGVDIKNRSRAFQLAVGGYASLREYNDFQLRSRNWNRIYPDESENQWEWVSNADRQRYNNLRSRREHARNRIPMLLGAMTVNRILSAVSAYNRARNQRFTPELLVTPVFAAPDETGGYMGTLRLKW